MCDKTSYCIYIEHIFHRGKQGDDFDNWFDMNNCQLPHLSICPSYHLLDFPVVFPSMLPLLFNAYHQCRNFSSVSVSIGTTVQHDIFSLFGLPPLVTMLSLLVSVTDFFLWSFLNLFWILIYQDPLNIQNKNKISRISTALFISQ